MGLSLRADIWMRIKKGGTDYVKILVVKGKAGRYRELSRIGVRSSFMITDRVVLVVFGRCL